MFAGTCVGGRALPSEARGLGGGDVLVQWGVRAIPVGIAAMVLGFVLKSAGTQAGPTDPLPAARISVFGTIHPEDAPLGSGAPGERLRLASIKPPGGVFDWPAHPGPRPPDAGPSA